MPTTLHIDDKLYREAKAEAARQGLTITRFIEEALKLKLRQSAIPHRKAAVTLPTFSSGEPFPYSPKELKALMRKNESAADRKKVPLKHRRK